MSLWVPETGDSDFVGPIESGCLDIPGHLTPIGVPIPHIKSKVAT